jgi:hypothetical protein
VKRSARNDIAHGKRRCAMFHFVMARLIFGPDATSGSYVNGAGSHPFLSSRGV